MSDAALAGVETCSVRHLCNHIDYGFTASAVPYEQGPRFLRITDIQNGKVDWGTVPGCDLNPIDDEKSLLLQDGDIVFARTGATTGKSFLIRNPPYAVFASYLIRLRLRTQLAFPDYLYLFFQSDAYWSQIRGLARGGIQPNVNGTLLGQVRVPLPPLAEQKRLAAKLSALMELVGKARSAADEQFKLAARLPFNIVAQSLETDTREVALMGAMEQVTDGVGKDWVKYELLGATRGGVAPAMAAAGKNPGRYKRIDDDTVFYNPMRILIGSIAMLPTGSAPAITSPDYVVLKGRQGILSSRWFFHWLRSPLGEAFIRSNAKGAVRERLTWKFLSSQTIRIPSWATQQKLLPALERYDALVQTMTGQAAQLAALPVRVLASVFGD